MDYFLSTVPTTLAGWVVTIIFTICAMAYLFSRIRQSDMKVLRDANQDLRNSIDDGDKKIVGLEHAVNALEHKVEELEKKNRSFEDLIVTALKQYFFENPTVATQVQKIIK